MKLEPSVDFAFLVSWEWKPESDTSRSHLNDGFTGWLKITEHGILFDFLEDPIFRLDILDDNQEEKGRSWIQMPPRNFLFRP
jgi:hypothetical protein